MMMSILVARVFSFQPLINCASEDLGEDEDWLWNVANEMEIEDGVIWGSTASAKTHRLRNREPDRTHQNAQGRPRTAQALTSASLLSLRVRYPADQGDV